MAICVCGYSAGRRKPGHGDDIHPGDSRSGETQRNCGCDEKQTRRGETAERGRGRGSREGETGKIYIVHAINIVPYCEKSINSFQSYFSTLVPGHNATVFYRQIFTKLGFWNRGFPVSSELKLD